MKYRREVDGLRAVAVIPVVLFHAGFQLFSGGFVGVDVFFVISGYLITTIILGDAFAGRFSIAVFYERRARRILPALFAVMLAVVPFAWVLMVPSDFAEFSRSMVAVALFASNILFWRETDYFATAAELKPLLHTWSLAVEEQYYVVFPLLIVTALKLGKRWMVTLLALGGVLSLGLAQWASHAKPAAAFFLLPTRAWELLIGVFVAIYLFQRPLPTPTTKWGWALREAAGVVGLALIAFSVFAYDNSTPFPGVFALAPTVGTALILLFAGADTTVGKLLGSRILVGIGLISYSIYLWHQPVYAFVRLHLMYEPSALVRMLLAFVALALAYLTWRYVEAPFRDRARVSTRRIAGAAIVMSVVMIAAGAAGHLTDGFEARYTLPGSVVKSFERSPRSEECFDKPGVHLRKDWLCRVGLSEAPPTFMVFGDSHALSLLPAFEAAADAKGVSGVLTAASGCAPLLGTYPLRPDQTERDCHALNQRVYEHVKASGIRDVFLVARWTYYTDGGYHGREWVYLGEHPGARGDQAGSRRVFESGLARTVASYARIGVRLTVVDQVPEQTFEPKYLYYRTYSRRSDVWDRNLHRLSVSQERHEALQKYVRSTFARHTSASGLRRLSLDRVYCAAGVCRAGTASESYYHDSDHVSVVGARMSAETVMHFLR